MLMTEDPRSSPDDMRQSSWKKVCPVVCQDHSGTLVTDFEG